MNSRRGERLRERCRVQRVTIMDEVTFPDEEPRKTVCQIPRDLGHPRSIRIWSDACDLNPTSREFHHEKHNMPNKSERRPDLHGEEVGCGQRVPVIPDEFVPGRFLRSLGCRLDAVILEDPLDRRFTDSVVQIAQCTLDSSISPIRFS